MTHPLAKFPGAMKTLSKSDFKAARTCATKLYYRELGYPSTKDENAYLEMLAQGGYMVEALARQRYPDGITLECGNPDAGAAATLEALKAENVTLFEATLLAGQRLARVDILIKRGNHFKLIEVKAKSFDSLDNAARLAEGDPNLFRSKRAPHPITEEWREYLEDVAFQVGVLAAITPESAITPYLCLVDKAATTDIDGLPAWFRIERVEARGGRPRVHRAVFIGDPERARLDHCTIEVEISAEVADLREEVEAEARRYEASLVGDLQKLVRPIDFSCRDCEYRVGPDVRPSGFAECWGPLAQVTPSVLNLYHGSNLHGITVGDLLQAGKASLFDVPRASCVKVDGTVGTINERQLVQLEHTSSGSVWVGRGLRRTMEGARYPLHFIDFETSRLALPYHAGMRPYGLVAFQWSCHTLTRPGGQPTHAEWINTEDAWPNGNFVRSLQDLIGDGGTILAWATHEGSSMKEILRELPAFGQSSPEVEQWIRDVTGGNRILDLNKITRESFFHPAMGGRTSIKIVLDALWKSDHAMRARFEEITSLKADAKADPYMALPPLEINGARQQVVEGTGAMRAYEAMMYGVERDDSEVRDRWRKLLLQYCSLDTLAMVLIWEYWGRLAI
jgi:hypothetical protein